jgi:multiple antibiotic resistance protein
MLHNVFLLFIVLDPFGNLVTINSLLRTMPPVQRRRIMLRESLFALAILLGAVYAGGPVVNALGLKPYSLGIAGGIVLFMISMGMVFPARRMMDDDDVADPFIVPIAMPLIAGPGTISLILLLAEKQDRGNVAFAVLIAGVISASILTLSPAIYARLGDRGTRALERLMGMLLVMLAVQMVLDGIQSYLQFRA